MDEKAMERDERITRVLIKISNWWERQKSRISNFIFIGIMDRENPLAVAERVSAEVKNWNEKYAGHCEICGHDTLRTLYWLDDPRRGLKCFECSRCHHKQATENNKLAFIELWKKRIIVKIEGRPRYMLISNAEMIWLTFAGIVIFLFLLYLFPTRFIVPK
ncbi:hypothetical protein HZB94_01120 [Candidatus Falkowbacteria bacterium]|nr:hypothetical protein [Candidatus Falkowbacteria bacterium]